MSEALYALLKQKKNVIKANLSKDPSASTEKAGLIRIATLVEALKGNEDNTAITPHTLKEVGDKKFGASIGLDLDPETFQLTLSLINGKGETLSSETIDLPSENALTDVDYDNDIKSLIFTYESGDTKTVSIEHVIDGLQPEITEDNKLPSDLVDDTDEQHKFVTPEEKQWLDDVNATANEVNQLHESNVTKADLEKLHSVTADANELNILDGATLTTQELNYVDGVTSSIQDQLNKKLELNSLSIKSNSTNYLGYNNTNGQISAKVDTAPTNNSTKLITSGGTYTAISNHNTSGTAHDDIRQLVSNNTSNISTINSKIPQQASSSNQLADKDFVNSSISTNTANFIGTFSNVSDLRAYFGTVTNNDYAFVINSTVTDNGNDWATFAALDAYDKTLLTNFDYAWVINGSKFDLYRFDIVNQIWESRATNIDKDDVSLNSAYNRYKATVHGHEVQWDYEYTLNNSSFTADQWTAINSNITPELTAQITTNKNNIATIQGDYVPKSRTVNGKALSSNITLNAGDVNALPASTTINDLTTQAQQDALNSGANTTKINQIATNTSSISTINGKIPSNASTTNKMSTAVDLSNAVENLANKQLDNLDRTGDNKLYALRGLYNNGELLTDAEGLADVKSYAHSTFDRSKFTVVGTPTITDDGLASGFSGSNYLQILDTFNPQGSWEIILSVNEAFLPPSTNDSYYIGNLEPNNKKNIVIGMDTNGFFKFWLSSNGTSWDIASGITIPGTIKQYTLLKVGFDGTKYYFEKSLDGETWLNRKEIVSSLKIYQAPLLLGTAFGSNFYTKGSIDLKQFSITVDGVEVFSGNETGIDVIKPDNYNTPSGGLPAISADGIASGFTTSKYIIIPTFSPGSNAWEIYTKMKYKSSTSTISKLIGGNTGSHRTLTLGIDQSTATNPNTFVWWVGTGSGTWDILSHVNGTYQFIDGQEYYIKLSFDGSTYRAAYSLDGVTYITDIEYQSSTLIGNNRSLNLGLGENNLNNWLGSIDLNETKIYVNGDLAYQPLLRIPYTKSSSGSKVANSMYLSRVKDAYEQGYLDYQYYTLDEDAGNFTLPMGELYGLINHNTQAILEDKSDIAEIQSDIAEIQEVIPTDASSSNKLVSASTLSTSIADFANKDLNNLSTTGTQKLRSLNAYANEGELLTDAEGLADVKRYAHSTFDLSKFTVVGSPNITDDGIASGFSSSNKITFTNPITSGSKFEIITKVKIPSTTGAQYILSTPQRGFILGLSHAPSTRRLQLYLSSNGTSWDIADAVGNIVYTVGKEYYFKVKFTGTQYIFSYSEDGINYTVDKTINSTSSIYQRSTLQIGGWNNDGAFQSSINLKQFSITVDGVEVFSGNKTGIDTIKPDDYTVVGTPTISADGIASGFVINPSVTYDTSMTCVKSSITLGELIDKDWMIDISFQYVKNTVNTARRQVILSAGDATMWVSMCGVYIDTSNKVQVGLTPVGYTDYYVLDISASNIAQYFNSGDIMRVKMSYIHETGTYRADILKGDDVKFSNTFIAEGENTNIAKFVGNPEGHFNIGSGLQNNNGRYHGALGSIDLNALKIYVDGDLVYQPCLKIPYTESKTGSKIVNAIYLDRVKDAYEQGYLDYQYYTLDEDTNEFTLPLGEVYGLISNANSNIKTNTSDISSINEKIPTDASSSNQLATAANITDINNKIPSGASSSNKLVATSDLSSYAYATNIVTLEDTSTITLANNTIYNGATLTDFTIALPATDEIGFICEIDFSSGTTATSVTYPNTITWIGDDISSNVFAPATNKRYTIMISYNGVGYVAVVKGINE